MVAVSSKQLLMEELSEHNVYFDMIVEMIPTDLSNAGKSGKDFSLSKSKYLGKVVRDIQGSNKETTSKGLRDAQAGSFAKSNDDRSKFSNVFEIGQDISANQRIATTTKTATPVDPKQSRMKELQAKLHAKIAAKEAQRPSTNPDQVSKRAGRRAGKERRRDEAVKRKEAGNAMTSDTTAESL